VPLAPSEQDGEGETETVICPMCGVSFVLKKPEQRFCSRRCAAFVNNNPRRKKHECICRQCGRPFMPKQSDRMAYCSRECFFEHKREMRPAGDSCRVRFCVVCGNAFRPGRGIHKTCSLECRMEYLKQRARAYDIATYQSVVCTCQVCGRLFTTKYADKSRVYCSDACRRRASNAAAHESGRNNRERTLRYGGRYEYVKPSSIFERDGWRCRQCGRKTPKRLRGSRVSNAPELDHIIPVSAGGDHAPYNLQCLCRACNIKKAAAGHGQLVLV
jgi:predicted nucleic acid-binding Zn ribbon protein